MSRDTLFNNSKPTVKFEFDDRVADVFDDMLDRSVPYYRQVMEMIVEILQRVLMPGDTVYDLGCSTGTTITFLAGKLNQPDLRFVGMDNSPAMLGKALRKAEMFSVADRVSFVNQDIVDADLFGAGSVILNYTLQFLDPTVRPGFLQRLHRGLRDRGIIILSEKVVCRDRELDEQFLASYHQFKMRKGYSELEIANKREALENVLIPCTIKENHDLLLRAGFSRVTTFFQWFNFVSFAAFK